MEPLPPFVYAALALVGIAFSLACYLRLLGHPNGRGRLLELAQEIHRGAMVFLRQEYARIAFTVIFLAVVALLVGGLGLALALVAGATCSLATGWLGMEAATRAGARTTQAALDRGATGAFQIAYLGGSITGLAMVSLGFGGLSMLLWIALSETEATVSLHQMNAFALGASCVALFARVGGGIFTKGADVGADLAGKVEAGIPEDDPRNPGVIADNVGDCVGDTAGMGADLFESYVSALLAASAIAAGLSDPNMLAFPFTVAGIGLASTLIVLAIVLRVPTDRPHRVLHGSLLVSGLLFIGGVALAEYFWLGQTHLVWAVACGVLCGILIGLSSFYVTSGPPVRRIAEASLQGAAPNVILGLAYGMRSVLVPVIALCLTMGFAYHLAGLFGIALAAVGMLGVTGLVMTADAYGPIADNAGGLAEMSGAGEEIRRITDELDTAGNTTAAIGKGFAMGSAALTSLALFAAYHTTINRGRAPSETIELSLTNVTVIIGLLLGVALPFVIAASTMQAVGRVAQRMVEEIRRQFREIPGLLAGSSEARADSAECVRIATTVSLQSMLFPGVVALLSPVAIGFLIGPAALGGFLAGAMAASVLLGLFMANGGGAWDNAKKHIEAGAFGGKGSPAHAAAVIGDTIGDPFKDTAGPSLNILIKLMSVVALFLAPFLG